MYELHSHARLDRVLNPASIAVIGASSKPGSFGQRTLENLASFTGKVFPVNAKYRELEGRPCYPDVESLPEPPDCVFIVIPRESVEAAVQDCVRGKAGGVVILTSGFSETGNPLYAGMQMRIEAIARAAGMPVVGPNCLGLFNALRQLTGTFATTSPLRGAPGVGRIGMVSQSGAMGISLTQSVEHGVSFSHLLTAGNSCNVDVADLVAYLAADDSCSVVACLFEGMASPRKLLEAGRIARAKGKPVLIYKFATGEEGAAAAMSHTGSLAGSNVAYDALFEEAGFIQVRELDRMVEAAAFFAKAPRVLAPGIGVVTGSGGAAILLADCAERHGVPMPQLSPPGQAVLQDVVPEFGAARNPCDLTAQAMGNPQAFPRVADAFLADPAIGALMVVHSVAGYGHQRMPALSEISRTRGKITCIVWLAQWLEGPGATDIERDPYLALFRSADSCVQAVAMWQRWCAAAGARQQEPAGGLDAGALLAARTILDGASTTTLSENQSRAVLEPLGVPFVPQQLVAALDDALAAAGRLGYPVAMKIDSPDLPHKTEAGVVSLGIRDEHELRVAWDRLHANARAAAAQVRIHGVLVQKMAPSGVEVVIGGRVDPLAGALVTVGMGGVLVELLRDTASALCPVTPAKARAMLLGLQGRKLLEGYRGAPGVDIDKLADVVVAVSYILHGLQDRIAELDVNPLICGPDHLFAVDALVVPAAPA